MNIQVDSGTLVQYLIQSSWSSLETFGCLGSVVALIKQDISSG